MIEVVFADKSPSKLGLLVRQAKTPAPSDDPTLASAILFAILERAADAPKGVTGAVQAESVKTGKPRKPRQTTKPVAPIPAQTA